MFDTEMRMMALQVERELMIMQAELRAKRHHLEYEPWSLSGAVQALLRRLRPARMQPQPAPEPASEAAERRAA
jgi:hypothetical protein